MLDAVLPPKGSHFGSTVTPLRVLNFGSVLIALRFKGLGLKGVEFKSLMGFLLREVILKKFFGALLFEVPRICPAVGSGLRGFGCRVFFTGAVGFSLC